VPCLAFAAQPTLAALRRRAHPATAAGIANSQVDAKDFDDVKRLLVERGEVFAQTSIEARTQIAQLGVHMLPLDVAVVLTHGYSRVVVALFLAAAKTRHFSVMVAESHPDGDGHTTAKQLSAAGVPVIMVEDNAVAHVMPRCQMVLCGAEAVVESGGACAHARTHARAAVTVAGMASPPLEPRGAHCRQTHTAQSVAPWLR